MYFPVAVVPSSSLCYIFTITWQETLTPSRGRNQKNPCEDIGITIILCSKSLVISSKFPLPNKDKAAVMDSGVTGCGDCYWTYFSD